MIQNIDICDYKYIIIIGKDTVTIHISIVTQNTNICNYKYIIIMGKDTVTNIYQHRDTEYRYLRL